MMEVKAIVLDRDLLERIPMLMERSIQKQIATNIMEGARAYLIQKAQSELNTTQLDYVQSVQPIEVGEDNVALVLTGALANMVEHGWDARFLHDTLLDSGDWKMASDGTRYRSIPFRHKTKEMGQQFAPKPSNNPSKADIIDMVNAKAIGKRVRQRATRLITAQEKQAGKSGRTRLPSGLASKLKPHHATDIFAGMQVTKQPVQKSDGSVGFQKTYTTFRTISDSRPDGWYHPGIEAHDFFTDMGTYIEQIAPKAAEAVLLEVLK